MRLRGISRRPGRRAGRLATMTQDYQDGFERVDDAADWVWEPVDVTGPLTIISLTTLDGRVVFAGPAVELRLGERLWRVLSGGVPDDRGLPEDMEATLLDLARAD